MALVVYTGDLHEGGILVWILGREAFLACCELVYCKWWLTHPFRLPTRVWWCDLWTNAALLCKCCGELGILEMLEQLI